VKNYLRGALGARGERNGGDWRDVCEREGEREEEKIEERERNKKPTLVQFYHQSRQPIWHD
jgi:hypothetical protein